MEAASDESYIPLAQKYFCMIQEKLKLKDELEKGSAERTAIVNQLKNEVRQIFHVLKFISGGFTLYNRIFWNSVILDI